MTTSLDDVLRRLATTTRRTRRTTRSTADGDVAGVNRTTNARRRCPSCMGWRGGTRTWNDDAAVAVTTTTIAALLSLSSSDHRSHDCRCRHSSPPDPSHRMPSLARINTLTVNRDCTSISTTRIKTMRRHYCRCSGIRTNDDSMTTTTAMVTSTTKTCSLVWRPDRPPHPSVVADPPSPGAAADSPSRG